MAYLVEPRVTLVARPQFLEPAHLPVEWRGEGTDGERLAEFAGRLRHMSQRNPAGRTTAEYLAHVRRQGPGDVLEHASYGLLLEGVSRALAHELGRHGAGAAVSELSPRAADAREANFVVPPAIIGDAELEAAWRAQVEAARAAYAALAERLMARYRWVGDKVQRRRIAREAARGVLPHSTETKVLVTADARVWRATVEALGSEGAELEARRLAVAVLGVLRGEAPAFFGDFEVYEAADRREALRVAHSKV